MKKYFWVTFSLFIGFTVVIIILNYSGIMKFEHLGQLGDSFGVLTSLFTGLAFVGMVWTILLQQDALKKQGEALKIQIDALDEQIKMFKRQGLIELHHIWTNTSDIDLDNVVVPDVIQIVNALTLTASVWNHDVIEKEIIFQNYWPLFKEHYETLHSDKILPGKNRKCRSFLTPDISKAYSAMKKKEEDLVKTSSVGSN